MKRKINNFIGVEVVAGKFFTSILGNSISDFKGTVLQKFCGV